MLECNCMLIGTKACLTCHLYTETLCFGYQPTREVIEKFNKDKKLNVIELVVEGEDIKWTT